MNSEVEGLQEQLTNLRRDMKRQRWVNAGLLIVSMVAASAVTVQSQTGDGARALVCRSLSVVNEDGREVILIGANKTGGTIALMGENDKHQIALVSGQPGGAVTISDRDGEHRVILGSAGTNGIVSVLGQNLRHGVTMASDKEGGMFFVCGSDGNQRVVITGKKANGVVNVYNDKRDVVSALPAPKPVKKP
jgi:hypothetical protein